MRSDLPVTELAENVYLLNEFDGTNCYLVVGSEKALLIDCGTGFCDIRGAAEKLTDLPITLAATHGHGDHIGGAGQFEEIYIHRADCERLNKAQMSLLFRKAFLASNTPVKSYGFKTSDVKPGKYKTKIIPMDDGHIFDLGGKSVRVKHTPGHSRGSVAFIDEQDKIIFSGDNVCDALWMQLPGVTSIEEWLPSARWLYGMSEDYRIFWGHRVPQLERGYIAQVIAWGEEIMAKSRGNTKLPRITQYPNRPDGIIYRTDKVFRK